VSIAVHLRFPLPSSSAAGSGLRAGAGPEHPGQFQQRTIEVALVGAATTPTSEVGVGGLVEIVRLAVKNDIQPLKMVLFVDKAHLLLPKENKAGLLSQLARQGRSWGFPVWLASQDADKLLTQGTNETNFAQLAECDVHFSPQTLSAGDQKLVLGAVIDQKFKKAEAALCNRGRLQTTGMARQFWKEGGK
jgi:hypothetical protein